MVNGRSSGKAAGKKSALFGVAVAAVLVVPFGGSAALLDSGFSIRAVDVDEPQFEATRSMNGLAGPSNPGGGDPGGENPSNSFAGTVTCGDESVTVTQAMLDFSDKNREAVAAGESAETWPDGDWQFISAGSYWEATMGSNPGVTFDKDMLYLFSSSPDTTLADFVSFGQTPHIVESKKKTPISDYANDKFSTATGNQASIIGGFSVDLGDGAIKGCDYRKFEAGKISSSNANPAYYTSSDLTATEMKIYAKNGLPAFGPERPSYESSMSGSTVETSYFAPNGERWDYYDGKGALWHPSSTVSKSSLGESQTDWVDCFSDECSTRFENPVVARDLRAANQEAGLTVVNYTAPLTNGADRSVVKTKADGTVVFRTYEKMELVGGGTLSFSRTNGPAEYYTDGESRSYGYWINGQSMVSQSDYENAGGSGWIGKF